jgi:hypothetical protein
MRVPQRQQGPGAVHATLTNRLVSLPHISITKCIAQCAKASNGKHKSTKETLIIGGRGPNDRGHNPSVQVGAVQIYKGILTEANSRGLAKAGVPNAIPSNLKLDLRGSDYGGSGTTWKARTGPSGKLYGNPGFDRASGSFFFNSHAQWAGVALNTDGHDMPKCSYSLWAFLPKKIPSGLGWAMSQYPDHGWSRSITLNDHRLSKTAGVSATIGGGWANTLPKPPVGKWFHVVASWDQGKQTCVYLNGKKGQCAKAGNGRHGQTTETLIIGGRGPNDRGHNPSIKVAGVMVFDKVVTHTEVTGLYKLNKP